MDAVAQRYCAGGGHGLDVDLSLLEKGRELECELNALAAWKESALALEREWNEQAVAKMLNVPLGISARAGIAQRVAEVLAERNAALAKLRALYPERGPCSRHREPGPWDCEICWPDQHQLCLDHSAVSRRMVEERNAALAERDAAKAELQQAKDWLGVTDEMVKAESELEALRAERSASRSARRALQSALELWQWHIDAHTFSPAPESLEQLSSVHDAALALAKLDA